MNRLAEAASGYLRMHADNPIDWWEWSPEALAEAATSNRPILLSIGYSACHWCHVMAAESFADPDVAALVNPNFVAIKVDREERPDLDQLFLAATQALSGSGGWPMTVFLTPQGEPFFAGTYFPPEPAGGLPSFSQVVTAIDGAWRQRQDEAVASAASIAAQLAPEFQPMAAHSDRVEVWAVLDAVSAEFDPIHGGFGTAPKFPAPLLVDALLVKGEPGSLDVAQRTLDAMARGGIHDQIGGGFARYSVDAGWTVPHFEKMLYDNALLLGAYTRGWRRVPDHDPILRAQYERVVRGIVGWLEREMLLESGGFAASLDADSLDIHGREHEGIYYCWNQELLVDALGESDGEWAAEIFHVGKAGNFEHGLSTLQLRGNPDPERLAEVSARLLAERQQRFAPARDPKVVAAWNGWLIDSLIWAATVFDEPIWLGLAHGAAECLWRDHWDGRLHRIGAGELTAFAEDYGAVALGFARLAGALGEPVWLERAVLLLEQALELFAAPDGGFFDTAVDAEQLWARPRSLADNPTPSGTNALIAALRLVSLLAERPDLDQVADRAAKTLIGLLGSSPRFAGAALVDALAADEARTGLRPAVAVVVSDDPLSELTRATWRMAPIGTAVLTAPPGTAGFGSHLAERTADQVYVCRGTTCFAPTADLAELRTALWSRVNR